MIEFMIVVFIYVLWNNKMWKETLHFMKESERIHVANTKQIKALKATIQKDREKIADYLNELTKNSNE